MENCDNNISYSSRDDSMISEDHSYSSKSKKQIMNLKDHIYSSDSEEQIRNLKEGLGILEDKSKELSFSQKNNPENGEVSTENVLDELIKDIKNEKPSFLSSDVDKKILLDNYNYILTDKAKERLDKLYTYISNGVPVLLEGETGCSKTLSAEIICKYMYEKKKETNLNVLREDEGFIKFNLSADVKINDLIKKFIGNKNSLSGLKIVEGPFLRAFKEGIPLILDEINLASEDILQCIEGALDSGEININISGIGNITQKKKEGFCLIATQNPNKDNYKNKRQNLSKSFLSHFQIIHFPSFEIEELNEIALKLFQSFNNNKENEKKT